MLASVLALENAIERRGQPQEIARIGMLQICKQGFGLGKLDDLAAQVPLIGICTGAFVLAQCGLMKGRKA